MTDVDATIERYIAAWNETDAERRRALVAQTWTDDATYIDPLMSGEGLDEIDALIATAQAQFPDHRFELVGGADEHNGRVRFTWRLYPPRSDAPVATGFDFGTLAEDGRLREVTGFLEMAA